MKKLYCLFASLLVFSMLVFAQNRTISGTVVDEKGDPAPGVSVIVKNGKTGTGSVADNSGQFRIIAKTSDILVLTGTGFLLTEATVGTGNTMAVTMNRNVKIESEVVVTVLGQTRQPKELGYAVSKVKGAELTAGKAVNLQNGLTGKVSGLNVTTTNSGVFADTRITLRGIRSLTGNNQPMLIVDGVPIDLNYISSINPNDITDVTILKSASATAIYGPDGANGALVITTKKGSKLKPSVSFGHTVQIERVSYMPEFQQQFGSGSSVDAYGYGVYDPIENQCYGDEFDGSIRQIGRVGPNGETYMTPYIALPKEKLKFWETGITNQTDVSFSTGDFYLSAQNVLIQGIQPKDVNRRVSIHLSANKEYNKFKASYSINYTKGNFDVNDGQNFGNGRDFTPYWNLVNTPMQIPVTRFKNWQGLTTADGSLNWANPNYYYNDYYHNPYWTIDNFRKKGRTEDIFGNVELNYKATSWLNLTYRLGATISNATSKSTAGAIAYTQFSKDHKSIAAAGDLPAQVIDGSATSSRLNSEFFLTARKMYGDFKLDALVGQSFREDNSKNVIIASNNLAFPQLFNIIGRKGDAQVNEGNFKSRLMRFFGKVGLNYNNWAFLELTGSYDVNSRLANYYDYQFKNINYFYPGASVSFLLSEAIPALKSSKTISYLKLRGAYSKTGNVNLDPYSLQSTYGLGGGFPYGSLVGYTATNLLLLPSYQPEFVKNKEIGFELSVLKNRITVEATAYSQDNSNQIVDVAYSGATGFNQARLNAASFTNRGLEFDLKLTPLIKIRNVSVDLKANYTLQENEVTRIIEGVDQLGIGNGNYVIVGQPAYTFQLTDYVRDDQGRVIVDGTTGLPTVDPTIKPFGQTAPKHLLGLNLGVTWKDITFSLVADYRAGAQIYTGNWAQGLDFSGISKRSGSNSRQPFIMPNSSIFDGTKYVENTNVYMTGGYNFWSQTVNTAANSNYLVSADFWKIREASLSWNMPIKWFGFTRNAVKGVSLTLSGRNLFMFLPKSNEWTDPEFSNNAGNAQGVTGFEALPATRVFGASINVQL
ncbi:MAG TPA: SusC/RagA family TonB-linked outer membrane protein [Chitinophagaceae bacterium]|jgi:TonB-linked SusC/RagA family outer membrane protein|nr:SusC/RagA family TonB-linked outer membrane protein [Chitinophagaceae bacterium]